MSDLTICHIIAGAPHGGAETFCLDTIIALDERRVKQIVISRPHQNYLRVVHARNIPHHPLSFSRPWKWYELRRIKRFITET